MWRTVGGFSLVTDKLVKVSKCSRVAVTFRRQLSNAWHDYVRESTTQLNLTADNSVQLHTSDMQQTLLY